MRKTTLLFCWLFSLVGNSLAVNLIYAPAPIDNPLKGFEENPSFGNNPLTAFPHSLVFQYISLRDTVTNLNAYDWTALETAIKYATNDGSQLVPRFVLDYPGNPTMIPQYLLDGGLWTTQYDGVSLSPDYTNANLVACLTNFIGTYGTNYDNDPRIAFVEIGLLSPWGEWDIGAWHNLFTHLAPLSTQQSVYYAYTNAFRNKKLLIRYTAGVENGYDVPIFDNRDMPFGIYDDGFSSITLSTNYSALKTDSDTDGAQYYRMWRYVINAGTTNKWKQNPNGGEFFYSQAIKLLSSNPPVVIENQTFSNCVQTTHSTFMHVAFIWYSNLPPVGYGPITAYELSCARSMGYELFASAFSTTTNGGGGWTGTVTLTNTGVAPFYYNWKVQLAAVTNGVLGPVWDTPWTLTNVVPGDGAITQTITTNNAPVGNFTVVMRVVNPMANGRVLKFANTGQDQTLTNWVTLGSSSTLAADNVNVTLK